ncbi:hypothetical protein NDU88_006979 [Pleurodeles waltl]|uniref:Uncharacterized protein n=1 Tax=Pleurodeles waltl TaxID=8319 RepID=A0AAV7TYE2_PLEWA|nr:hypothetical protein NDU88_006979 [Pleurodeles waltl]
MIRYSGGRQFPSVATPVGRSVEKAQGSAVSARRMAPVPSANCRSAGAELKMAEPPALVKPHCVLLAADLSPGIAAIVVYQRGGLVQEAFPVVLLVEARAQCFRWRWKQNKSPKGRRSASHSIIVC